FGVAPSLSQRVRNSETDRLRSLAIRATSSRSISAASPPCLSRVLRIQREADSSKDHFSGEFFIARLLNQDRDRIRKLPGSLRFGALRCFDLHQLPSHLASAEKGQAFEQMH